MLIKLFLIFFVVYPYVEWWIHYILHKINNNLHENHHNIISKNNFKNYTYINNFEIWPFIVMIPFFYIQNYYIILGLLKYWIVHTITHYSDKYLLYLKKHHILHHKYKKYNFSVTAIWPDILMNTVKYK